MAALTMADVAAVVADMSASELDAVITGRAPRLSDDEAVNLAVWNAAIDRENGYDD